jgi:hypothetical protein
MTFALIDELRVDYTVDLLCEILAVSGCNHGLVYTQDCRLGPECTLGAITSVLN